MTSSASTIVTIIVLAILAFFVIRGFIKGFLKILFSTFSFLVVLIIVAFLTQPFSTFLKDKTFVGPKVEKAVSSYVDSKLGPITDDLDDANEKFIDSLPLPSFMKKGLKSSNNIVEYAQLGVTSFKEYISLQVTTILIKLISYVLLAILISILLKIIFHILKVISKIPILHGINKFFGLFLGLFEGLLVIWCICIIIMLFSATDFGASCMQVINGSKILTFIYNSNPLVKGTAAILSIL